MASEMCRAFALTIYLLVAVANGLPATNNVKNNNYKSYNPYERIQAESYTQAISVANGTCLKPDHLPVPDIFELTTASIVQYAGVEFTSTYASAQVVTFRVSNYNEDATETIAIELHLGNATNLPIGTVRVNYTGDQCSDFQYFAADLDSFPTGTQDLYLTFPSPTGYNLAIDYFYFNHTESLN